MSKKVFLLICLILLTPLAHSSMGRITFENIYDYVDSLNQSGEINFTVSEFEETYGSLPSDLRIKFAGLVQRIENIDRSMDEIMLVSSGTPQESRLENALAIKIKEAEKISENLFIAILKESLSSERKEIEKDAFLKMKKLVKNTIAYIKIFEISLKNKQQLKAIK